MAADLVSETEFDAGRAGRPGLLLNLNPDSGSMIAVDIDIDRVSMLVTNFGQTVLTQEKVVIKGNNSPAATLAVAAQLVEKAFELSRAKNLKVFGVCVTWAGLVDRESGKLAYGPTSGWQRVPLKADWEARFGVPVYVENEAHAGAIGAYHFGARPGVRNMVYLSLGVGLAAGVFVDGVLLRGKQGYAGQVGHVAFAENGIKCSCGKEGCWVTEIGAARVLSHLDAAGVVIPKDIESGVDWVEAVITKAKAGDANVLEVLNTVGRNIGLGLSRLVQTFNPSTVIVGGRMADLFQFAEPAIREAMLTETMPFMSEPLDLIVGTSGEDSLRGGIATVFDAILKNPAIGALAEA
ncbi:MAG: ROK family protein [Opitutaceae bacterium]